METLTAPNRISYQWNNVVAWLIEVYMGHIFHLCLQESLEYLLWPIMWTDAEQHKCMQIKVFWYSYVRGLQLHSFKNSPLTLQYV